MCCSETHGGQLLGTSGITGDCEPPDLGTGNWTNNSGPLEEKYLLLISGWSLQPLRWPTLSRLILCWSLLYQGRVHPHLLTLSFHYLVYSFTFGMDPFVTLVSFKQQQNKTGWILFPVHLASLQHLIRHWRLFTFQIIDKKKLLNLRLLPDCLKHCLLSFFPLFNL